MGYLQQTMHFQQAFPPDMVTASRWPPATGFLTDTFFEVFGGLILAFLARSFFAANAASFEVSTSLNGAVSLLLA